MEIVPLGVYSDADERAFHRHVMDESARIGPPPALESYLKIGAILDAARAMGADSVHPDTVSRRKRGVRSGCAWSRARIRRSPD